MLDLVDGFFDSSILQMVELEAEYKLLKNWLQPFSDSFDLSNEFEAFVKQVMSIQTVKEWRDQTRLYVGAYFLTASCFRKCKMISQTTMLKLRSSYLNESTKIAHVSFLLDSLPHLLPVEQASMKKFTLFLNLFPNQLFWNACLCLK